MSTPASDLPYWAAWSRYPKIGPTRFARLRQAFPTMAESWRASAQDLRQIGFDDQIIQELLHHRQNTNVDKSWEEIIRLGLNVTTIADDNYPTLLKEISNPPALLYWRGNLDCLTKPTLATVGARRMTVYGQQTVGCLIPPLASAGLTIISGLAYGIDTACHQAALSTGGYTVGVLACGLDQIYPAANNTLGQKIIEQNGLLLSEYPPGVLPLKHHFPVRNRIIAGLAQATLILEATLKSGALITAKLALEYNRDVFAVPGSILSEMSQGTNELLKLGAIPALKAEDILATFNLHNSTVNLTRLLNEMEKMIINALNDEPKHVDELARLLKIPAGEMAAKLTLLELEGIVKNTGQQKFIKLI